MHGKGGQAWCKIVLGRRGGDSRQCRNKNRIRAKAHEEGSAAEGFNRGEREPTISVSSMQSRCCDVRADDGGG